MPPPWMRPGFFDAKHARRSCNRNPTHLFGLLLLRSEGSSRVQINTAEISRMYGVSRRTVYGWVQELLAAEYLIKTPTNGVFDIPKANDLDCNVGTIDNLSHPPHTPPSIFPTTTIDVVDVNEQVNLALSRPTSNTQRVEGTGTPRSLTRLTAGAERRPSTSLVGGGGEERKAEEKRPEPVAMREIRQRGAERGAVIPEPEIQELWTANESVDLVEDLIEEIKRSDHQEGFERNWWACVRHRWRRRLGQAHAASHEPRGGAPAYGASETQEYLKAQREKVDVDLQDDDPIVQWNRTKNKLGASRPLPSSTRGAQGASGSTKGGQDE